MAGAALLGIPVLSAIFALDLSPSTGLLIILTGGGLFAAANLTYYAIVAMRCQHGISLLYAVVAFATVAVELPLTKALGIRGASLGYLLSVLLMFLLLYLQYAAGVRRMNNRNA